MSRGRQDDPVKDRSELKSLSSAKTFFNQRAALKTLGEVDHWLHKFSLELWARLEDHRDEYDAAPTTLTVSFGTDQVKSRMPKLARFGSDHAFECVCV